MHVYMQPPVLWHTIKLTMSMMLKADGHKLLERLRLLANSALLSINAVCANIKHNRYFHETSYVKSIYFHAKMLYGHTFDMVDTTFSY